MFALNIIDSIGSSYNTMLIVNSILGIIIFIMLSFKPIYYIIGFFFTRKFKPAKKQHKYGIAIAARNEEKVIGHLLDSIKKQDYPQDLLTIFVVADNCNDKTAEIAKKKGAIVYERFDNDHRTKGYALEYLFDNIEKDYKRDSFDGFFIFDADNLLKKNYITKMNDAFDSGVKIVTSYRNTKNFDENWIASTYAIHWLRSIRMNHRPRSFMHLATNIQGTGFLFAPELIKNGWHYTSLTEDRAFTADAVVQGYEISYQDEAEFYDEQPTDIKIMLRQRLRWSRGHLLAFVETGPKLFANIFLGKLLIKNKQNVKEKLSKRIIESIRHRWASFDTFAQLLPYVVLNVLRWLLTFVIVYTCFCYTNGFSSEYIYEHGNWIIKICSLIFGKLSFTIEPGTRALWYSLLTTLIIRVIYRIGVYIANMAIAIYVFLTEGKRIKKINIKKKILYILTWPTYDAIWRLTMYVALFKKVDWKPVPHNSAITIEQIEN
jgi:cellulose synthase/poly-beta-1,6-N-acetylglucosamine synthase-like glycosyltransferase